MEKSQNTKITKCKHIIYILTFLFNLVDIIIIVFLLLFVTNININGCCGAIYSKNSNSYKNTDDVFEPFSSNLCSILGMKENNGFEVIKQCDVDGVRFYDHQTERIVTVARKQ